MTVTLESILDGTSHLVEAAFTSGSLIDSQPAAGHTDNSINSISIMYCRLCITQSEWILEVSPKYLLLGWRPSLLGWRPSLLGWRSLQKRTRFQPFQLATLRLEWRVEPSNPQAPYVVPVGLGYASLTEGSAGVSKIAPMREIDKMELQVEDRGSLLNFVVLDILLAIKED